MLFPSLSPSRRESDEVGPWLMACMMGIAALWRNFSVSEQNNIDSSTPPPPQDERRDRQTYGYVPDNDEEKIFDRSLGTFVREKRPPSESVVENSHPKTVASSEPFSGSQLDKSNKRYLEILVHNVSHTDLVLSLEADLDARASTIHTEERENMVSAEQVELSTKNAPESRDPYCLCRPRFSFFDHYCRAVLENLTKEDEIVSFPRYQRAVDHPRYSILSEPSQGVPIPTGLHLYSTSRPVVADLHEVRVRGRDHIKVFPDGEPVPESDNGETVKFPVSHVFFPLLATLLPHWEQQITEKYRLQSVKRVLILVTGVGTPRNWTHSVKGNSTQACADLMEKCVHRLDPDIVVVKIHSDTNIFRYDENMVFVQQELIPVINAYRDAHARGLPYPD